MRKRLIIVAVCAVALGLAAFWWLTIPATVAAATLPPYTPDVANGAVVFNAGGCASCHATPGVNTPGAPPGNNPRQPPRLGGGLALASPFGTFYVPNLSPDSRDGIGNWGEANFLSAVLKGTSPHGAHYFPAFPYAAYQHARVDDVRDLFAYLKTLPAVDGPPRPKKKQS